MLCLIEESFDDYSDDVCGAVANVRVKDEKIAIWTTKCENRDGVTQVGKVYKERLGLPGYQSHTDTATKSAPPLKIGLEVLRPKTKMQGKTIGAMPGTG